MFTTSTHCIYTVYITQNMKKQIRCDHSLSTRAQRNVMASDAKSQISSLTNSFTSDEPSVITLTIFALGKNYYCCYSWEALIQFFWDGPARLLSLGSVQLMASYKTAPGSHSAHIKKSSTRPCHFLGCIIKISQCSENRVYVITE